MTKKGSEEAKVAAVKQLVVSSVMLLIQMAIFFLSAGYIGARPRIYFDASFVHYAVSIAVQYKLNPELLAARLAVKRRGSKMWDEILMRSSNLVVLIVMPVVAGLDIGRFGWSSLDFAFMVPGFVLLAFSTFLLNWAMAVNPFFEPTVRIQEERNHKVVAHGPYRIVRHPGYLAGLLFVFSVPLIIGSAYALAAAGTYLVLVVLRTTLSRELAGYSEYSRIVKYRLLPGVW
jgi:protein-S-isoprenylcysteine O-methyltransferase Ste14